MFTLGRCNQLCDKMLGFTKPVNHCRIYQICEICDEQIIIQLITLRARLCVTLCTFELPPRALHACRTCTVVCTTTLALFVLDLAFLPLASCDELRKRQCWGRTATFWRRWIPDQAAPQRHADGRPSISSISAFNTILACLIEVMTCNQQITVNYRISNDHN